MNNIELIDLSSGIKYNLEKIKEFCENVLNKMNIKNWEFSLVFCDNEYISKLNEQYRMKKGSTDVLTFSEADTKDWVPPRDGNYYAGDIIISIPMLIENSEKFCVDEEEELKRLIIHGILHLKGMNHETNDSDEEMLICQEEYLVKFGEFKF